MNRVCSECSCSFADWCPCCPACGAGAPAVAPAAAGAGLEGLEGVLEQLGQAIDSWEPERSPGPVASENPVCPHCGCDEFTGDGEEYRRYVCSCGYTFEAELKTVYVCRRLEERQ